MHKGKKFKDFHIPLHHILGQTKSLFHPNTLVLYFEQECGITWDEPKQNQPGNPEAKPPLPSTTVI